MDGPSWRRCKVSQAARSSFFFSLNGTMVSISYHARDVCQFCNISPWPERFIPTATGTLWENILSLLSLATLFVRASPRESFLSLSLKAMLPEILSEQVSKKFSPPGATFAYTYINNAVSANHHALTIIVLTFADRDHKPRQESVSPQTAQLRQVIVSNIIDRRGR
jgi:hypothetical protein